MTQAMVKLGAKKKTTLLDQIKGILPESGNLDLCLTCGMCSSGCPAAGIDDMDPRKLLRMISLGLDDQVLADQIRPAPENLLTRAMAVKALRALISRQPQLHQPQLGG